MTLMFDGKPGDLIEIFRWSYKHWAIYVGGEEVVHLVRMDDDESGSFGPLAILESSEAMVKREKLSEVVGFHRYHINNVLDDEYEAHDRHVIVREACGMVGRVLPYSITTYNCEHFATEQRYGKPESRQVNKVAGAVAIAGVATAGMALAFLWELFPGA